MAKFDMAWFRAQEEKKKQEDPNYISKIVPKVKEAGKSRVLQIS